MAQRRTLLIVAATLLALTLVALLGWRSYAAIRHDESTRIARRQQVLAGTIAIAISSEIASWNTQLRQLDGLPSVQYLTEASLPGRLNDMFAAQPGAIVEIVRYTADGRLRSWRPLSTRLDAESPMRDVIDAQLLAWSRDPAHMGVVTSTLIDIDPNEFDLVLATPTYQTAVGNEDYLNPSGAYDGLLAFRLDIGTLVSPYITHALRTSPESTAALLVGPGRTAYVRTGSEAADGDLAVSPELWARLLQDDDVSLDWQSPRGGESIASWARVTSVSVPIMLWLDQSSAMADRAVWPLLLRQAPMFGLLTGAVLMLAWALQRSHRSEERYRALVTHAADGIIVLTPEGTILETNPAGSRLLGRPRASVVGQTFASLLDVDQLRVWHEALAAARGGQPQSSDWTIVAGDSRQVAVAISLAPVSAGRLMAIVRDISERRALETQLRQAQKMEAVGRLAGGIAHDFNNLLTAILGYNELLLKQLPEGDPRREDAAELGRAAERAADLTRRLLAFGRRQLLEPRVFDLNDLIRGLEALLRRLMGSPVTIVFDLTPDLWRVEADPGQIEQVLVNLAVNGRDAMPTGGTLRIATENVTLKDEVAQALDVRAGDYVAMTVTDSGIGISDEVRPHLFEPFFTTKPVGTGTGLGLPTVYGIVQQSGGAIQIESRPGHGATLRIFLPRTFLPLPDAPPRAAGQEAIARGTTTVLLVEDEVAVRDLLEAGLTAYGYRVLPAADPLAALELFDLHASSIGALMSDVVMPHMSGTALAHRLRALRPTLPVVLMSGYAMDVFEHEPPPEGAVILQKPFTTQVAVRALAPLLQVPRQRP